MAIAQQTLGTGATTLYTSSGVTAITALYLMNDHNGTVVVQLHVVSDGDTAATANKIIKNLNQIILLEIPIIIIIIIIINISQIKIIENYLLN